MDITTVILSIYLLFPTFTDGQTKLLEKMYPEPMSQSERLSKKMDVKDFIDVQMFIMQGELENGTDVSTENQKDGYASTIGNLENPLYGPQSQGSVMDFLVDGINAAEVLYKNSMDQLALFEYGEEFFVAPSVLCGRKSLVAVNKDSITRTEYDDFYRVLEKTVWKNGSTSSQSTMSSRVRYTYENNQSKIPKFCGQEDLDGARYIETRYNRDGKITEVVDYDVGRTSNGGVKRILKKKNNYAYDVSSRLVMESELENFDNGNSKSTKKIYSYTSASKIPSVSYYEEGELRIKTEYVNENDYIQTVYFDEGFKIATEFRDGERVLEITYMGDNEVRRREF